ncbi:MAG: arginine--tRNA ligase, partial [Candidatus Diapherotrites archaeon]|nr:arginine--tRNA ligase [Candidatus Diapherotrites archaeon]
IKEKGKWLGKLYASGAKAVKENPELEEKMREMVVQLEKGDKNLAKDWKKLRKSSLEYFDYIYKQLGIKFDKIILESEVEKEGIKIANQLHKEKFAVKDEGALLVDLKKYNLDKFLILKSDGAALYSSKDLALAKMKKKELKANKTYNVVGAEQRFYFQQLIKTLELLNKKKNEYCETIHVPYELVILEEGKMASREGNVITYSEVFEKVLEKTLKETKTRHKDWDNKKIIDTAEKIAIAAIKFGMLRHDKNKTIVFSWSKATSLEGETGPFIQYSYARAKSILRKAGKTEKVKTYELEHKKEKKLVAMLALSKEKIKEAENSLTPHKIAYYLVELAS